MSKLPSLKALLEHWRAALPLTDDDRRAAAADAYDWLLKAADDDRPAATALLLAMLAEAVRLGDLPVEVSTTRAMFRGAEIVPSEEDELLGRADPFDPAGVVDFDPDGGGYLTVVAQCRPAAELTEETMRRPPEAFVTLVFGPAVRTLEEGEGSYAEADS